MKESEAIELFKKTRKDDSGFNQKAVDYNDELWNQIRSQISEFDIKEERIRQAKRKKKTKKEETVWFEEYKGLKSTSFSEENWERIKKDLPLRLLKPFMPKRLNSRNSREAWGRRIYVVKKDPDYGITKGYCAYDAESGLFIGYQRDKEKLLDFIEDKILEKEEVLIQAIKKDDECIQRI